jgi:predicted XRE-type DNA-binding protein
MKIGYFDTVWDAIEPSKSEAANMKARADLMIAIHKTVQGWNTTQAAGDEGYAAGCFFAGMTSVRV